MADEGLPLEVMRFIEEYITSVEQLEILLLLCKNDGKEFTVQSVYDIILSNRVSVEAWLERFVSQKLVREAENSPGVFQYSPANEEIRSAIAALGQAYRATPVRVIEAIYKRDRKMPKGDDPAQGFADAFWLKKK